MAELIYRNNETGRLLQTLGSFWATVFTPQSQPYSVMEASMRAQEQTQIDLLQATASAVRFDTPVYRHRLWKTILLDRDQLIAYSQAVTEYGQGRTYGDGLVYGESQVRDYRWPAPAGFAEIRQIMDRPIDPTVVWSRRSDFRIEDGDIVFQVNPFESDFCTGAECDRIVLWLYGSDEDVQYVSRRFRSSLAAAITEPETYKRVMNAAWDLLLQGPTMGGLMTALSAATGAPVCLSPGETVEVLVDDPRGRLVVTDKNVYAVRDEASIVVAAGDTLTFGQPITSEIVVVQGRQDQIPEGSLLPVVVLPPTATAAEIRSAVVFSNEAVSTETLSDPVRLRFPIGGSAADVEAFWTFSEASDTTVAEGLRLDGPEPYEGQLPATVNPVDLFFEAVPMAIVISITAPGGRFGMSRQQIRQFLPPHHPAFLMSWAAAPVEYTQVTGSDNLVGMTWYDSEVSEFTAGGETITAVRDPLV